MGNWKMNGSLASNQQLLEQLIASLGSAHSHSDVVVCAPYPYLAQLQQVLANSAIEWGAQNLSAEPQGAFTGEVSAQMLNDFACKWVLVGHSERRALYGETDADVLAKTQAALEAGITPVVCVGETESQRDAGQTLEVIGAQLAGSLPEGAAAATVVVAYEPIWAIGTGRTPTLAEIAEVHSYLRARLAERVKDASDLRILYGGSVKPSNAAEIFAVPHVDGALVGGASLKAADFGAIVAALAAAN